jgi:hypothetical protein
LAFAGPVSSSELTNPPVNGGRRRGGCPDGVGWIVL